MWIMKRSNTNHVRPNLCNRENTSAGETQLALFKGPG